MNKKKFDRYIFKLFLTTIIFTFFSSAAFPQNVSKDIRTGLELCYNFKWKQAEEIFSTMIKENPENSNGYHFLSGIYLWYYLGNRDKEDFNNFVKYHCHV